MQKPDRQRLQRSYRCRTFKHAECVRHAQGCHRKERGSHSVLSLLTKEAEKAKKNRVRTILAVLFLRVEKIALHKLPAQAKLVFRMGFTGVQDVRVR
jgi:hypothetical protein